MIAVLVLKMGNSGSYTSKAHLHTSLYTFTKWGKIHINDFLLRGQLELSETFGLRRYEVEFLVGRELVDFPTVRSLFSDVFDTDKNSVIDKFELMSMVCLVSKISNLEKIHFLFDLFNFNEKGYLIESELMLLFLSISRGAYKVDQKYAPLPIKAINGLVKDALSFAVKDSTQASLRKPELVQFVLDTDKVMAFLESWRGIASQVLIRPGERWRDLSFPANETSIYATDEWLRTGLPPADFVKWRRCSKVGHDGGCDKLFSHTVGYMKTVDRKPIYEGWGCLASGHIKQGMLSDRWLLNGLACIFAKPVITTACFASTGQEVSIGRYCIRIYEGGAWRSVYLDDRIPCGKNCLPLFASSSDPSESFVMLLEKGVAKYLGSYGHLARASAVPDATLTSLRMLTGGHVFREATLHYEWRSLDEEILGESGRKFVDCLLKEGSLVSFGRAESIAYMKRRDLQINLDDEDEIDPSAAIPPYGRLFPLLGIVTIQSCVYLILRDAWGLNTNIDEGIDFETGHSRTFQVPVEEIPLLYDVMIISRFPDSLQPMMEKHNLTPWRTEVRGQATNGVKNPAKFKLILPKKVPEQLHKSEPKTNSKKKSTEAAVNETLRKVDELDIYDVDPSAYIKKNATSFARFKTDPKRETIISNMSRRPSLQDNLTRMTESLIDIAFTISG